MESFLGVAFVSFEKEEYKSFLLQQSKPASYGWCNLLSSFAFESKNIIEFNGSKLLAIEAPEPEDIIWENITSKKSQWKRLLSGKAIELAFFTVYAISIYYILAFQLNYVMLNIKSEEKIQLITFVFSCFQVFINSLVLPYFCKLVVQLEKYDTYSSYSVSYCTKLSIALSLNSGGLQYFFSSYYYKNIYDKGGFIY